MLGIIIYSIILEININIAISIEPLVGILIFFVLGLILGFYWLNMFDYSEKKRLLDKDINLFFSNIYIFEGKADDILINNFIKYIDGELNSIDYRILTTGNTRKSDIILRLENLSKRLKNRFIDLDYINFIVVIIGIISISGISIGENILNNLLISFLLFLLLIYFLKRGLDIKHWRKIIDEIDYIKYKIIEN